MEELKGIESIITVKKLSICQALSQIFCHKNNLIPFWLLSCCCISAAMWNWFVTAYVGQIFLRAGVPNPDITSFGAGLGFLLSAVLSGILVKVLGRTFLLAVSVAGMGVKPSSAGSSILSYKTLPMCQYKLTLLWYLNY